MFANQRNRAQSVLFSFLLIGAFTLTGCAGVINQTSQGQTSTTLCNPVLHSSPPGNLYISCQNPKESQAKARSSQKQTAPAKKRTVKKAEKPNLTPDRRTLELLSNVFSR